LDDKVFPVLGDVLSYDYTEATLIVLYMLYDGMIKMRPQLMDSLRRGCRIVSSTWKIEGLQVAKEITCPPYHDQAFYLYDCSSLCRPTVLLLGDSLIRAQALTHQLVDSFTRQADVLCRMVDPVSLRTTGRTSGAVVSALNLLPSMIASIHRTPALVILCFGSSSQCDAGVPRLHKKWEGLRVCVTVLVLGVCAYTRICLSFMFLS
jgi:hypothetical protein